MAARRVVIRAQAASTSGKTIAREAVPLELEKGEMPLNTFGPKTPFKATVKSVKRIVGPKATGETCDVVIQTDGKIPFWEGQSYGVIPPVSFCSRFLAYVQWNSVTLCNNFFVI